MLGHRFAGWVLGSQLLDAKLWQFQVNKCRAPGGELHPGGMETSTGHSVCPPEAHSPVGGKQMAHNGLK